MKRVFRSFLAVLGGFVAATAVMMIVESVNGRVFYPEFGKLAEGVTDRDVVRRIMASAPLGALLVVLAGWAAASLVGAMVTAWIATYRRVGHALVLGAILTAAGIANNLMLPPPSWFWICSLVVFIPLAYAGAQLASRRAASMSST